MVKSNYTPIDKIIKSAKKGEMYILVDDENRENEGDLVVQHQKYHLIKLILWLNMVED